jgi:hypothetical protein
MGQPEGTATPKLCNDIRACPVRPLGCPAQVRSSLADHEIGLIRQIDCQTWK